MTKEYNETVDPTIYTHPEDYRDNRHKLEWPDRGAYHIENMVVDVIIAETGTGVLTSLAKRSISDLYTESGVERLKSEIKSHPANIQDTIETLSDQVVEALHTTGDYALIRNVFFDTLNTHYITKSVNNDEKLTDDQAFELAVRFYTTIRVIRHIIIKNEAKIQRALMQNDKRNGNKEK